jgi:hypothetical protein
MTAHHDAHAESAQGNNTIRDEINFTRKDSLQKYEFSSPAPRNPIFLRK